MFGHWPSNGFIVTVGLQDLDLHFRVKIPNNHQPSPAYSLHLYIIRGRVDLACNSRRLSVYTRDLAYLFVSTLEILLICVHIRDITYLFVFTLKILLTYLCLHQRSYLLICVYIRDLFLSSLEILITYMYTLAILSTYLCLYQRSYVLVFTLHILLTYLCLHYRYYLPICGYIRDLHYLFVSTLEILLI